MIKDTFKVVQSYEHENYGRVYLLFMGIKEFSGKFNVSVEYINPKPHIKPMDNLDFGAYFNINGVVNYQDENLHIEGEEDFFWGKLKFERPIHPDAEVVVRIYDNLSKEQVVSLLTSSKFKNSGK